MAYSAEDLKKQPGEDDRQKKEAGNSGLRKTEELSQKVLNDIERFIKEFQSLAAAGNMAVDQWSYVRNAHRALAKNDHKAVFLGTSRTGGEFTRKYHPSLSYILKKNGKIYQTEWETIVEGGGLTKILPESWPHWFPVLSNDRDLADRLIRAVAEADKNALTLLMREDKGESAVFWIITAVVIAGLVFLVRSCMG
jgi:hypothetical protein